MKGPDLRYGKSRHDLVVETTKLQGAFRKAFTGK
jgi:hypothetical protein